MVKKNRPSMESSTNESPGFLQCAGVAGQRYERLRMAALAGAEAGDFSRWGMVMLVPDYAATDDGQLWRITRARASIRAGEVSVKDMLDELGVLAGLTGPAIESEANTVVAS